MVALAGPSAAPMTVAVSARGHFGNRTKILKRSQRTALSSHHGGTAVRAVSGFLGTLVPMRRLESAALGSET